MFHIGEKITNLRKEKNMTQEELSNLLNVSRQTISKWESEKIYPDVNNLILISNLFSCSIDYLLIENEEEKCIHELDEELLTFGERIIKLRKKNYITQEQLADHLGVSRQALFKWESNKSYPEIDKLIGLSKVFNCSIDYLLRNKEIIVSDNKKYETDSLTINCKEENNETLLKESNGNLFGNINKIFLIITAVITFISIILFFELSDHRLLNICSLGIIFLNSIKLIVLIIKGIKLKRKDIISSSISNYLWCLSFLIIVASAIISDAIYYSSYLDLFIYGSGIVFFIYASINLNKSHINSNCKNITILLLSIIASVPFCYWLLAIISETGIYIMNTMNIIMYVLSLVLVNYLLINTCRIIYLDKTKLLKKTLILLIVFCLEILVRKVSVYLSTFIVEDLKFSSPLQRTICYELVDLFEIVILITILIKRRENKMLNLITNSYVLITCILFVQYFFILPQEFAQWYDIYPSLVVMIYIIVCNFLKRKEHVNEGNSKNIVSENENVNEYVLDGKKENLENNKPRNRISVFILDHIFNILFILCLIVLRIMLVYTVHAVTLEFYFMRVFLVLPALRFILLSIVYKEKRFLKELQIFIISICLYIPLLITWELDYMFPGRNYLLNLPGGLAFLYLAKLIGDKNNKVGTTGLFIYFLILASIPIYGTYLRIYYSYWEMEMLGDYIKIIVIIELIIFVLIALYNTVKLFLNKCEAEKKIANICLTFFSFMLLIDSTFYVFGEEYIFYNSMSAIETTSYYIISMMIYSIPLMLNFNKNEIKA